MDILLVVFILILVVVFGVLGGILLTFFRRGGHDKVVIKVRKKRKEAEHEPPISRRPSSYDFQDFGGYVNVYYLDTDTGEFAVNKWIYNDVKAGQSYEMEVRTFRDKVIAIEAVLGTVKDK